MFFLFQSLHPTGIIIFILQIKKCRLSDETIWPRTNCPVILMQVGLTAVSRDQDMDPKKYTRINTLSKLTEIERAGEPESTQINTKQNTNPRTLNSGKNPFPSKPKSSSEVRMFCDFTTNETSYSLRAPEVSFPKSSLSYAWASICHPRNRHGLGWLCKPILPRLPPLRRKKPLGNSTCFSCDVKQFLSVVKSCALLCFTD